MSTLTLLGAFLAGLLSFLSPCVLPLTPIYLGQLVGPSIWGAQAATAASQAASAGESAPPPAPPGFAHRLLARMRWSSRTSVHSSSYAGTAVPRRDTVSSYAGTSGPQLGLATAEAKPQPRPAGQSRVRVLSLAHASAFVAGFSLAFIALGATASELGALLSAHAVLLRQVGGVVLIALGLHVAGMLHLPGLERERRLSLRAGRRGYPFSLLVGVLFGLGWTPCVGPILGGILLLAAQSATLGQGVLLLAAYSMGLGVPFLALGLAFDRLAPALKRLTPHLRVIEMSTGALLAVLGLVIFFNWLVYAAGWFGRFGAL